MFPHRYQESPRLFSRIKAIPSEHRGQLGDALLSCAHLAWWIKCKGGLTADSPLYEAFGGQSMSSSSALERNVVRIERGGCAADKGGCEEGEGKDGLHLV